MRDINSHIVALTDDYDAWEIEANTELSYLLNWLNEAKVQYGGYAVIPNYIEINKLIDKYL